MTKIEKKNISTTVGAALFILVWLFMLFMLIINGSQILVEDGDNQSTSDISNGAIEGAISKNESVFEEISKEEVETIKPLSEEYTLLESNVISELQSELNYCKRNLCLSQSIISYTKKIGYKDTSDFIQALYQDCKNYQTYIDIYEEQINELSDMKYTQGLKEYPVATYIWYYMKEQGWSDYVCAGIMGNIMQETGGRTLNIDCLYDGNGYYGMCCWKKQYHPEVVKLGLEGQCEYLVKTLSKVMDSHGYLYEEEYTFQDFLDAKSVEEVAAAFMIIYERPEHSNPIKRVENGEKAYRYFVG